jgi:putative two-component system response regulator
MPYRPILIIDDEPANLAALRQILKDDYRLVFARSGKEALEAVSKHDPSLILLDIQMPDMDGYEVCRRLKANPTTEAIPVIFVTSLSEQGNEESGFAAGCVDYLTKPVSAGIVRARVRTHLSLVLSSQLERSHRDAIFMLGEAGHYNDNDTGVHIWRMAAYSRALAKHLGWADQPCKLLEMAAAMHDTGKIGIPDRVLRKPGKLDAEEWRIMQSHAQIGYDILSKSDAPLFKLAAEIALNHHEKWNGSGYPNGLDQKNIPESARIVAIADVFDALAMNRLYKAAWPLEKILDFMNESAGQHFDPQILAAFMSVLPEILQLKTEWNLRETHDQAINMSCTVESF